MALFTAVKAASQILGKNLHQLLQYTSLIVYAASVTMPWTRSRRILTVSLHRLAYPKRHHPNLPPFQNLSQTHLLRLNQSQKNITVG